jgi:hypothetical protein
MGKSYPKVAWAEMGNKAYKQIRFSAGLEVFSDLAIPIRLIAFMTIAVTARFVSTR